MPQLAQALLEPRKSPVQARSAVTVETLLEATVQVLLLVGKERLTTTRVARRAGVSVGTLYQYFPNKSALLQAALRRHLEEVTYAAELACKQQRGRSLDDMATALISSFLNTKMRIARATVASTPSARTSTAQKFRSRPPPAPARPSSPCSPPHPRPSPPTLPS